MEKSEITDSEVQEVRELFQKADVITRCKDLAHSYFIEAKNSLVNLKPVINQSEAEFFEDLLTFVAERKF